MSVIRFLLSMAAVTLVVFGFAAIDCEDMWLGIRLMAGFWSASVVLFWTGWRFDVAMRQRRRKHRQVRRLNKYGDERKCA